MIWYLNTLSKLKLTQFNWNLNIMKLQISVVQVGQWTYIATIFVISIDSKSSNYNTTAHMGTVISLLRSSFKSCPILDGCLRFSQFDESLSASDKTKSYLSCDCLMLEFADVWDSGFQSLHSQSSQFEWSRERMRGRSTASLRVF